MSSKKIFVGIDFGTTHSGICYTYVGADDQLQCYYDWPQRPMPYPKDRTCILYEKKNGKWIPEMFGNRAYTYYRTRNPANGTYFYVEKFKLLLDPNSNFNIQLPTGLTRERLLKDYLSYMKYYVELLTSSQPGEVQNLDISWGITVPAMWSDSARNAMRRACVDCEIIPTMNSDLHICLEPEAAAIYAMFRNSSRFSPNSVVTIVDAGGGTLDLSTFKVLNNDELSELISSDGVSAGSTFIDANFLDYIKQLVGSHVYDSVSSNRPQSIINLLNSWESLKRTFTGSQEEIDDDEFASIEVPVAFAREMDGDMDTFVFSGNQMVQLFRPVLNSLSDIVLRHVRRAKQAPNYPTNSTHVLLFVGGFSASIYAQETLREISERLGLVFFVPPESSSAIVQGAALAARNPVQVAERCMRTTYGIKTRLLYNQSIHAQYFNVTVEGNDGERRIPNGFDRLVKEGEIVNFSHTISKEYYPSNVGQTNVTFELYSNTNPNAVLVDPEESTVLGTLQIAIPEQYRQDSTKLNKIRVDLQFGRTEIIMKAVHLRSGNACETSISYLE